MITVTTGSRLHFGLLRIPNREPWPSGRWFGGVGLLIDGPGLKLTLHPAGNWEFRGLLTNRVKEFAELFRGRSPDLDLAPQAIELHCHPSEHAGFGLGTQLGLAVATGLANAANLKLPPTELARRVGRGQRSAIGVHGFARGGLIIDAGKQSPDEIGQLAARIEFPDQWRVVTATPTGEIAWHGDREGEAFRRLSSSATDDLLPFVEREVLPALAARDLSACGRAVREFNIRAGKPFYDLQGGTYSSPAVTDLVARFDQLGLHGAGQSSWGPTVYGFAADENQAELAARTLRQEISLSVNVSAALNHAAKVIAQ